MKTFVYLEKSGKWNAISSSKKSLLSILLFLQIDKLSVSFQREDQRNDAPEIRLNLPKSQQPELLF